MLKGKTQPPPPPPTPPLTSPTPSGKAGGGGIYIASNVPFSTRVWDCKVKNEKIIGGRNGNIEPLREFLPSRGLLLQSDVVCRMSDTTPHESLPMKITTMRQFFRIMTCEVRFWYKDFKDYFTPNPLGVLPDPRVTEIVVGNEDELGKW